MQDDEINSLLSSAKNDIAPDQLALLVKKISFLINDLALSDFNRLVQILYKADVSETKLKKLLRENVERDAGDLIAKLLIERQLEKQKQKGASQKFNDIPEDEKW